MKLWRLALIWLGLATIAQAGEIEGVVQLRSRLKPKARGPLQRYPGAGGPLYQGPTRQAPAMDEVRNVVLYLLDTPGGNGIGRHKIDQKQRQFAPYVLPIFQGSTVEFLNGDTIYHSVYSQSDCRPFHLPEYPQGESREITFPQPGVVELFCAIHPQMNAYILVLDTGFYGMPGEDHRYRLSGVPPGKRVLKAWHPRLQPMSQIVDVPASGSVRLDLNL